MKFPPIFLACELYDLANVRFLLQEVKNKEKVEAKIYKRSADVKGMLESLGIDKDGADKHDFVTRMKIKMLGDI